MSTEDNTKEDDVFECARVIRSRLRDLLGIGAEQNRADVDRKLAVDLARAPSAEAADRISGILLTDSRLAEWSVQFLSNGPTRRGVTRSGDRTPEGTRLPVLRYACVQGDFVYYGHFPDEPVPRCPTHPATLLAEEGPVPW